MIAIGDSSDANAVNPPLLANSTKTWVKLVALVFGVISYQLNASMVAPAVPEIARRLNANPSEVAVSQTLFFLVGGISGVVLARYSDHAGRRNVPLYSPIIMCVGTLIAMVAPNVLALMFCRLLQGACGATFQITYLIMREILTPRQFGTALGLVTAISGGVGGADQFLGGVFSNHWGFRSSFLFILIVGLVAIVLSIAYVPESKAATPGRMDWPGAAALSAALICINIRVNRCGCRRWPDPAPLSLFPHPSTLFVL